MSGPDDVEVNVVNEEQLEQQLSAAVDEQRNIFGFPIKYVTAAIGAVSMILIIVALSVDELWTFDGGKVGWKQVCPDGRSCGNSDGNMKKRGSAWLAMGILSLLAATTGTICCLVDKYVTFMSERTKKILLPIRFAVSAILLFIGSIVVVTYTKQDRTSLDVGASPIIGFVTIPFLIVCTVLAYKNIEYFM